MSIHRTDDGDPRHLLVMKGAPERILERCSTILLGGETRRLDKDWQQVGLLIFQSNSMFVRGSRQPTCRWADWESGCSASARPGWMPSSSRQASPSTRTRSTFQLRVGTGFLWFSYLITFPAGLTFSGLISMIDPPRAAVPDAVNKCRAAGVKVGISQ